MFVESSSTLDALIQLLAIVNKCCVWWREGVLCKYKGRIHIVWHTLDNEIWKDELSYNDSKFPTMITV